MLFNQSKTDNFQPPTTVKWAKLGQSKLLNPHYCFEELKHKRPNLGKANLLHWTGIFIGSSISNLELLWRHEKNQPVGRAAGLYANALVAEETLWPEQVGDRRSGVLLIVTKSVFEVVAFSACRFKIKHQILHVHTKLAESLLNQVQDSATTLGVFHDSVERLDQLVAMLLRQVLDCRDQIVQIDWKLVWIGMVGVFGFHIHHCGSSKNASAKRMLVFQLRSAVRLNCGLFLSVIAHAMPIDQKNSLNPINSLFCCAFPLVFAYQPVFLAAAIHTLRIHDAEVHVALEHHGLIWRIMDDVDKSTVAFSQRRAS